LELIKSPVVWKKPTKIISDKQSDFINLKMKNFVTSNHHVIGNRHQSDGIAKRAMQTEKGFNDKLSGGILNDHFYCNKRLPHVVGVSPTLMLFKTEVSYANLVREDVLPTRKGEEMDLSKLLKLNIDYSIWHNDENFGNGSGRFKKINEKTL
jgi:hypothetical protein